MSSLAIDAVAGITLYLKTAIAGVVVTSSPWSSGLVTGNYDNATQKWVFTVADGQEYLVFQRLGGAPASTDLEVGSATVASGSYTVAPYDTGPASEPIRDPVIPYSTEVTTLHDLVTRLAMRASVQLPLTQSRVQQNLVRAIQDTMRNLGSKNDWCCYQRTLRFRSSQPVTGAYTLDADGSGGRPLVTLTGPEEFPSDAVYGEIVIGTIPYKIFRYIDNKNVSLLPNQGIVANSTGTLTWQRVGYRLDREIARVHYVRNLTRNRIVQVTSPADRNELSYYRAAGGVTERMSIQNVSGTYGATDFVIWPPPSSPCDYELSVTTSPQVPLVDSVSGTDASFVSGSNTMTSAAGLFTPWLVGCLVKVSYNATIPADDHGPFYEWRAWVTGYQSATQITLSDPAPATVSGRGFIISSPIDINPGIMLGYVEAEAYSQYCRNHNNTGLKAAMELAQRELIQTVAQDNQFNRSRGISVGHWLGAPFYQTYTQSRLSTT